MQLLLENLKNSTNRKAQFKTVATFLTENTSIHFTGVIKGDIAKAKKGTEGFGYDAIFIPAGFKRTFAEMNNNEKSLISHRAIAINQFLNYIKA